MSEIDALRVEHRRLAAAARAVVDAAHPAPGAERPLRAIEPHHIRRLRRELRAEPQPSGFFFMSTT